MNNQWGIHIFRFIVLVLLQVFFFSKLLLAGSLVPYVYLFFVLFLPIYIPLSIAMITSFLMGFCIDMFHNTGGAHSVACVAVIYFRPWLLATIYGVSYEFNNLKLLRSKSKYLLIYIAIITFIHHSILYHLEVFDGSRWFWILKQTLYSSLYTIFLIYLTVLLFRKKYK